MGQPWKLNTEIEPNYDGGVLRAKHLKGGVRTVKTKSQRNALPYLYRFLDATESTIIFVENESCFYRLINNPTSATIDSDWQLVVLGGISTFSPVGTWDSNNLNPTLTDAAAVGHDGEFYFVINTPTQTPFSDPNLFQGNTVNVVDGDYIVSVGSYFINISNSTTWDSLAKPQVIVDYVNGIVQAHTHTTADITDLSTYMNDFLRHSDVTDLSDPFIDVLDASIPDVGFLRQWYYTKTEVNDLLMLAGTGSFLSLSDTPSSYTGETLKGVRVNAGETGLEFYTVGAGVSFGAPGTVPFMNSGGTDFQYDEDIQWDNANNRLYIGASTSSSNGHLTVGGSGTGIGIIDGGGGSLDLTGGPLTISSNTGGYIAFKTNTIERLRINNAGAFLLTGSAGTSGQALKTIGSGGPPVWGDILYQTVQNSGSGVTQRTILNATNGLKAVDNTTKTDIKLGGEIIDGASATLNVDDTNWRITLNGQNPSDQGLFIIQDKLTSPTWDLSFYGSSFSMLYTKYSGILLPGYEADYSTDYTARTWVDQGYVLTLTGTTGAWKLASGGTLTGANTITGTTSNTLKYIFNSLGVTQTNGAGQWLANTTAATLGSQQISPSTVWEGQVWETTGSTSQSAKFSSYILPVQGTSTTRLASWLLASSINNGAYSTKFRVDSDSPGSLTIGAAFTTDLGIYYTTGSQVQHFINGTRAFILNSSLTAGQANNILSRLVIGAVGVGSSSYLDIRQTAVSGTSGAGGHYIINTSPGAHTGLQASTEQIDIHLNLDRIIQFATGTLALERNVLVSGSTVGFVGSSTLTRLVALSVSPGRISTNGTATNVIGLEIESRNVTNGASATNGFGLVANAPTGATNNFAARFVGSGTSTQKTIQLTNSSLTETFSITDTGAIVSTATGSSGFTQLLLTGTVGGTASVIVINTDKSFSASSGSPSVIGYRFGPTYNFTGSVSGGAVYGFVYAPTLTSMTGVTNYAFLASSGVLVLGGGSVTAGSVLADFQSTTLGVMMPRVTNIASVVTPVNGMIAYDAATNKFNFRENSSWIQLGGGGGSGDVVGPASATDTALALFDTGTGKLIKNSIITVSTAGNFLWTGSAGGSTQNFDISGTSSSTTTSFTFKNKGGGVTYNQGAMILFDASGSSNALLRVSQIVGGGSLTTPNDQGDYSYDGITYSRNTSSTSTNYIQASFGVTGATTGRSLSLRAGGGFPSGNTVGGNIDLTSGTPFGSGAEGSINIQTRSAGKIGFYNVTSIARPTTAIAAATFVANTSLIANDTATFDGYTVGQIVKALRNYGLLT